jgi:RNA polymerase sigma-70 factor (ECF subfamily)
MTFPGSKAELNRAFTDEAARLVEQLQPALRKYCLSLAESPWDAEDLAQEAWLRALRSPSFDSHPNPEALLLRVAKNAWVDRGRRSARLSRMLKEARPSATMPDDGSFEIEAAFRALIMHLTGQQRAAFVLRDVLGYTSKEAAFLLGTTEGALKAVLHRARHRLLLVRQELEQGDAWRSDEEEPGLKAYLKLIASAYQAGDTRAMLALVQRIEAAPSAAIGILHSGRPQSVPSPQLSGTPFAGLTLSRLAA